MATVKTVEQYDDFSVAEGDPVLSEETVKFSYRGQPYIIDLTHSHAAEFDELMAPYIKVASKGKRAYTPKSQKVEADVESRVTEDKLEGNKSISFS